MAETTDSEDGETFSWAKTHLSESPKDSHARAEKWGGLNRGKAIGNLHNVACRGLYIFCIAAIDRDARDLLFPAKVFVSLAAKLALATGVVNPWDADTISDFEGLDGCAPFDHTTGDFVAEDKGLLDDAGELHPIAVGHVYV